MGSRVKGTGWGLLAFGALAAVVGYLVLLTQQTPERASATATSDDACVEVLGGSLTLHFDGSLPEMLGKSAMVQGNQSGREAQRVERMVTFDVLPSTLTLSGGGNTVQWVDGVVQTRGAIVFSPTDPRVVIGNLSLGPNGPGAAVLRDNLSEVSRGTSWLNVATISFELDVQRGTLVGRGTFEADPAWDRHLGRSADAPALTGGVIVELSLEGGKGPPRADQGKVERKSVARELAGGAVSEPVPVDATAVGTAEVPLPVGGDEVSFESYVEPACSTPAEPRSPLAGDIGPDVIVGDLHGVGRYGRVGDLTAFAIATYACNIGDERASWNAITNEHPVIIQNLYRLKADQFTQIGQAWAKHGFYAVSYSLCGPCLDPVEGGQQLGVGCSDPYSAGLNANRTLMGPRSEVNAFTGVFPFPFTAPPYEESDPLARRMLVKDADIDPQLNAGAKYFVEGHYILADDAAAGNSDNNASYREVQIAQPNPGAFFLTLPGAFQTQREQQGVRAWADTDPSVVETDIRVPGEGLFILAAKVTDLGTGLWRYYYALHNFNSDRSGKSFTIPLPPGAAISNIGFRDIDYHSGEIYSGTDWSSAVIGGAITWFTEDFSASPNANALRFSTLYAFWFDANVEPAPTTAVIGLFKPGQPTEASGVTIGPKLAFIDCNQNGISDACDVDCGAPDCEAPCGGSLDCQSNSVPDECEPDCNENGVADECDILNCPLGDLSCADCNANVVPDGCETDCDGDGIPDDCDTFDDTDGDGIPDCFDRCPLNTPQRTCSCPSVQRCYISIIQACTSTVFSAQECLNQGFIPPCIERPCLQGCLLGDFEVDGDVDLVDVAALQGAFTGPGGFAVQDFTLVFDENQDDDIDLEDFDRVFFRTTPLNCPASLKNCNDWMTGPWESGPVPSLCP